MGSLCCRPSHRTRQSAPRGGDCDYDAGHICLGGVAFFSSVHLGRRTSESSLQVIVNPVKILYISQYFPPEMGAPAARAAELSRHWARDGHDVTVLTGFPNHPTGIVPAEYRAKFRHLVSREMIDGVSVIRTWLFPFPNCKAYERMLNYSSFCASSAST